MKRLFSAISLLFLAVSILSVLTPTATAADTDNFVITRYDAAFHLSRDEDNHSNLKTILTITANFPPNQNHGIAPVFIKKFDNHSTHFTIQSVTDELGKPIPYRWNNDELRIGEKNTYVSGEKTYIITYTERDVTRHYADTGKDEFYWDVIGSDWNVPIERITLMLHIDDSLVVLQQTKWQCYMGVSRSSGICPEVMDVSKNTSRVSIDRLAPHNGVTMALGFSSGTFAAHKESTLERVMAWWGILQIFMTVIGVACLIGLVVVYVKLVRRSRELNPIVPEYLPPSDTSVMTSAHLLRSLGTMTGSGMAAQLIDLAVRHYISLYEIAPKSLLRVAQYEIKIERELTGLKPEEQEIINDMFGVVPHPGDTLELKTLRNNIQYTIRTRNDDTNLEKLMNDKYNLRARNATQTKQFRRAALVIAIIGGVTVSPMLLIVAVVSFFFSFGRVLTDKGLALRRHLMGLKLYIGVGEQERLKMLQSPEGAKKVGTIEGADSKQLIKLYERTLPYAVLFNQEKNWSEQIGRYYEQVKDEPGWYHGISAFSASSFAASMSSLSAAANSTSGYSSTSGGSTGGGSVGGGGGGGGGGGW